MPVTKRRPIIGIPCSMYPDSWFTPANGNATSYLRAIEAAGGIPSLIHLTRDAEVIDMHYTRCDALLFAGGEDVDPSFYHAPRHPKLGKPNPLQDEVEIALARRARADAKPILGICRGMQLLNVAFGGTLYQDLPSEFASPINHNQSTDHLEMSYLAHPIGLEHDTWLAEWLGTAELAVNTLHHQGLRDVAPGLRAVGHAPDGLVEAVEGTGPGFVVAVQCHPEELWEHSDRRWARVFEGFIQTARQ